MRELNVSLCSTEINVVVAGPTVAEDGIEPPLSLVHMNDISTLFMRPVATMKTVQEMESWLLTYGTLLSTIATVGSGILTADKERQRVRGQNLQGR